LGWSVRRGTRAAQKVPDDFSQQCYELCLRCAFLIDFHAIPAGCIVNSDQMQLAFQYGGDTTWEECGAHQVSVLGKEEKRACTVMTGLAMSGVLLPFQSVWQGYKPKSLPFSGRPNDPVLQPALAAGHLFNLSKSRTYWSNLETMQAYVDQLLVPYLRKTNLEQLRSSEADCIWIIDAWKVHRGDPFWNWMAATYPWIHILFVPAGCT
ncbi:hypothetical protein CALCODRAFT_418985, partial [Calocera cornea HHB12733]